MSEAHRAGGSFVAYEYKELMVRREYAELYRGGFADFGWTCESAEPCRQTGTVLLRLRRERCIVNRTELTRLQRQFQSSMKAIERLEASCANYALAAALSSGVTGLVLGVGAVLAALKPIWWLAILLAVPALILCGLAMPLHNIVLRRRTQETEPLIDAKYAELSDICDKGHRLHSA